MKKYSHTEAFNILQKIESNQKVENIIIDNIQIWPLVKFSLFRTLTGGENKTPLWGQIKNQLKNYTIKNISSSYFHLKKIKKINSKEIIFSFPDSRRQINKKYYDILFDLDEKYQNIPLFEWNSPVNHIENSCKKNRIYFLDYLSLKVNILTIFHKIFYRKKTNLVIKEIPKHKIEFITKIQYIQFKLYKKEFENMFSNNNTIKKIYIKTSYTPRHQALIFTAKNHNIEVIELQHGIISQTHPGYIFKKKFDNKLFPDKLLVYGLEVKKLIENESYIYQNMGYHKQLRNIKKKYSMSKEKLVRKINPDGKKIILITSQWIKKDDIKKRTLNLLKKVSSEYIVILKTHPLEKNVSEFYKELKEYKNFKLITDNNISVYELFEITDIHTSFFSTCVFESLIWSIPNILFKDSDSLNLNNISNESGVYFTKDTEEYTKKLNEVLSNFEEIKQKVKKESKKFYI